MDKKLTAIIMAAGASTRLNKNMPKPFLKINGKPTIWYSCYSFQMLPFVKEIYIVINPNNLNTANRILEKYFTNINKFVKFILGGKERKDSVYNALLEIKNAGECDFVAIHDAARPFITPDTITKCWEASLIHDAASPGINVVDTIKICNEEGLVVEHPKRSSVIAIQTPQIFNFNKIFEAYENIKNKKLNFTDDTEIYSILYNKVRIIEGENDLFKITYENDLYRAKITARKYKDLWG